MNRRVFGNYSVRTFNNTKDIEKIKKDITTVKKLQKYTNGIQIANLFIILAIFYKNNKINNK